MFQDLKILQRVDILKAHLFCPFNLTFSLVYTFSMVLILSGPGYQNETFQSCSFDDQSDQTDMISLMWFIYNFHFQVTLGMIILKTFRVWIMNVSRSFNNIKILFEMYTENFPMEKTSFVISTFLLGKCCTKHFWKQNIACTCIYWIESKLVWVNNFNMSRGCTL